MGATALLLAVAGGAAAPRVDLGSSSGGAALLLDALTLLVVAGSVTGLILLVGSFRVRKSTPLHVERRRGALAALAVLVLALVLFRLLPDPRDRDGQGPTVGIGTAAPADGPGIVAIEPDGPLVLTALGAAVALAALAAIARRRIDRRIVAPRTAVFDEDRSIERVRRALLGVRADLEAITDPRDAILHAYERLRIDLQGLGVDPRPDDTPRRVLRRALALDRVPADAVNRLVAVFEEARFSTHGVGPQHREAALRALAEVEKALDLLPARGLPA
jgi:hypothetical protein